MPERTAHVVNVWRLEDLEPGLIASSPLMDVGGPPFTGHGSTAREMKALGKVPWQALSDVQLKAQY